jgi:flagellar hook-basal body protein
MNLALWSAKTGLDAQNTQMAIIANNLANANTTGFKSDRAAFQDLMYQNIRQVGAQSTQNTQYSTGLTLGTGVRIVATEKNYTQGSVTQTNGALDVVVNGRGFLQITMPDGTLAYTRDGIAHAGFPGQRRDGERLSAAAGDHDSRGHAVGHDRQRRRGHGTCPPATPRRRRSGRSNWRISSTSKVCSRPATTC